MMGEGRTTSARSPPHRQLAITFLLNAVMPCLQVLMQRVAELERAAGPHGVSLVQGYGPVSLPFQQQQQQASGLWNEEGRCSGTRHHRPSWGPLTLTVPQDMAAAAEPAVLSWPLME